ncbi:MAG: hypothetical protein VKK99_02925 [Cyanobacteriota bacterium]|nr:hypothetical protein [Cyanobacteriota bacterium]
MLRSLSLGIGGFLPALMLLPAGAAEPPRAAARARMEPITLAEARALGPIAQQVEPLPASEAPQAAESSPPAPSPWAGTVELYGFVPLRLTSVVKRGATERNLSGLLENRKDDLKPGLLGGPAPTPPEQLPDLTFPKRWKGLRGKLPDTIEIPGFTAFTDVGLGAILEHLTDAFAIRGSVEYNRIGFQTDLSYVGMAGQSAREVLRQRRVFPNLPVPTRTLKAQVAVTQGIYDFALRYRLGERERAIGTAGATTVIPYAGVRVLDLGLDTTTTFEGPLLKRSSNKSFGSPIAQPLLGLQGQVFVTPRLRLFARGDLAGFGANGTVDMSGNAQAGVGYAIGNSTQLDLSWRYLYLARDNGQTPDAAYTIDQNGIEMGLKVFF